MGTYKPFLFHPMGKCLFLALCNVELYVEDIRFEHTKNLTDLLSLSQG